MRNAAIFASVCLTAGLLGSTSTFAEMIGRYECNVVGAASQDPVGDKDGHRILNLQYSCTGVDGLLKGAQYTGTSTSEWDGPKGTYLTGSGIVRAPGSLAVTEVLDGSGQPFMKDGKPAGSEASGTVVYKCASGSFAQLSGKQVRWAAAPAGFGRFTLEVTDDSEVATARPSK